MSGTAKKHQENLGYGLPTTPGGRGTGRRSLHTADDGGRAELPGEAAFAGALYIVQEVLSEGVTGCATPNLERRGKRGIGAGGKQGKRGQQDRDIHDGVPGEGRTKDLPS